MDSGFVKKVAISLAIAVVLVAMVNVVGEFTVQPRDELPPPKDSETAAHPVAPEVTPEKPEPATAATQEEKPDPAPAPTPAPAPEQAAAPAAEGLGALLAAYDPAAGKKIFRKCKSCHSAAKGAKNRVGPNLWEVVGRDKGAVEGFRYSDALMRKGGSWTYKELDRFIANPRTFIIGTKMSIKGISDPDQRATIIGFLRALSDAPQPLPE